MSKGTTGNQMVWYLAWVRSVAAMASRPGSGAGAFQMGQNVYVRPLPHDKWMVFDGGDHYTILSTEDAKLALKSCRDAQGKARLAEHQEKLIQQFSQAVARHGTVFACRPRDFDAWQGCH